MLYLLIMMAFLLSGKNSVRIVDGVQQDVLPVVCPKVWLSANKTTRQHVYVMMNRNRHVTLVPVSLISLLCRLFATFLFTFYHIFYFFYRFFTSFLINIHNSMYLFPSYLTNILFCKWIL